MRCAAVRSAVGLRTRSFMNPVVSFTKFHGMDIALFLQSTNSLYTIYERIIDRVYSEEEGGI